MANIGHIGGLQQKCAYIGVCSKKKWLRPFLRPKNTSIIFSFFFLCVSGLISCGEFTFFLFYPKDKKNRPKGGVRQPTTCELVGARGAGTPKEVLLTGVRLQAARRTHSGGSAAGLAASPPTRAASPPQGRLRRHICDFWLILAEIAIFGSEIDF